MPADPDIRALLLDRAANDEHPGTRIRAVIALATMSTSSDPSGPRDKQAAGVFAEQVRQAALNLVLTANPEDSLAEGAASDRASESEVNWTRQLPVRLASCSAEFTPSTLPPIEDDQGILFSSFGLG